MSAFNFTPDVIYELQDNGIVRKLKLVKQLTEKYAIYAYESSKEPVRVYLPNLWKKFHRTSLGAYKAGEQLIVNRLTRIRERIKEIENK